LLDRNIHPHRCRHRARSIARCNRTLEVSMNWKLKTAVGSAVLLLAGTAAAAQLTFYEDPGYHGRSFSIDRPFNDLTAGNFNDRASSVVADGRWEVCEGPNFAGRCVMLRPGSYYSLSDLGMDKMISSARPVLRETAYVEPPPPPVAAVYSVPVSTVREIAGATKQRCWYEREPGSEVADLQHCETTNAPAYWDVTYFFRGLEHRVQLNAPPGPMIAVNEFGEPRQ
jgi:hypothetical protein